MPRALTPAERLAYEALRVRAAAIVVQRGTIPQRVLADAVGVGQTMISSVLSGRMISIPTLQAIALAILPSISVGDRQRLREELNRVMAFVRKSRR
jgi:hypothetical protein